MASLYYWNSCCFFSQIWCFSNIHNIATVPVLNSFHPICQTQIGQEDGPFSLFHLSRNVLLRPVKRYLPFLCKFFLHKWNIFIIRHTSTGQSPWLGSQQWSFPTTVEDELVPALPLSTHSAVEMLHDSALYKFMIDIDIDIKFLWFLSFLYIAESPYQRSVSTGCVY